MIEKRTRLRRGGLAVGALLCVLTTGCVFGEFGRVCTTIGYISTLRVELVGDVSDVVSVRLCDADGVCSVTESELAAAQEHEPIVLVSPGEVAEAPGSPVAPSTTRAPSSYPVPSAWSSTSTSTSTPPDSVPQYLVRNDGGGTWTVEMPFGVPDDVVISALRSDGSIADEIESTLHWKRVGGSEECGGPLKAGPVTLHLLSQAP